MSGKNWKRKEQCSSHFTQVASNIIEELRILAHDTTPVDDGEMFSVQSGADFSGVDALGKNFKGIHSHLRNQSNLISAHFPVERSD